MLGSNTHTKVKKIFRQAVVWDKIVMNFNPELNGNDTIDERWRSGEYDELLELREQLLSIAGREVVPSKEPHLEKIINRGRIIKPHNTILIDGRSNECHENSSLLYRNKDSITEIGSGWSLSSDDGLWRQHSWAMRGSELLVETTTLRDEYYGILLKNEEAEEFVSNNVY